MIRKFITLSVFLPMFMSGTAGDVLKQPEQISFRENKGQVSDQNYKPRPDVLFSGSSGDLAFHLRTDGISYQLCRVDSWKEDKNSRSLGLPVNKIPEKVTIYRIDVKWLNSNPNLQVEKSKLVEGVDNFYTTTCPQGALGVRSFKSVVYKNIYKGIDLHYYSKEGILKYDYIVQAGADYSQIQLEINGASGILKNADGSIGIETPLGKIIEDAPVVFQKGKQLKSEWILKGNVLSFHIEKYDPTQPLVIDPITRIWGTYIGGTDHDYSYSCTTDKSNNVYIAGGTASTSNIATTGAFQTTFGGGPGMGFIGDAFMASYNRYGVKRWSSYFGGSGQDNVNDCVADNAGNLLMVGVTGSTQTAVFCTPGAHQNFYFTQCSFIEKFDSTGARVWGTYYGGNAFLRSCAVDQSNNIFITGETTPTGGSFLTTSGCYQPIKAAKEDFFLAKFNSAGVRQWGTFYGGPGSDGFNDCTVDKLGNMYICGATTSTVGIATAGAHQSTNMGGANDGVLAKFNTNGGLLWATYYGGSATDYFAGCVCDSSNFVYACGITESSSMSTPGSFQLNLSGTTDGLIVYFDSNGTRQWSTYLGGSSSDAIDGCAIDTLNNLFVAGVTFGTSTVIATPGAYQTTSLGSFEVFLVQFDNTGARLQGTYYGGSQDESPYGCAVDKLNNVYVTGYSGSLTNIATPGSSQSTNAGNADGFLVQFNYCVNPVFNSAAASNSVICTGNSSTLSITSGTLNSAFYWKWYTGGCGSNLVGTGTNLVVSPTVNTTYYVRPDGGCINSEPCQTLAIVVNPLPIISITGNSVICNGSTTTLNVSGANSYTWNTSANTNSISISPTVSTTYSVLGMDNNNCINSANQQVIVNTPTITISPGTSNLCIGQTLSLTASGANTYTWSTSANTYSVNVSPTITTQYSLNATDANNCAGSATANVIVNNLPVLSVSGPTAICTGQSATLTTGGANTYSWSTGATSNTLLISPTTNTMYTVYGTDLNNCSNTDTVSIAVYALPNINANISPTLICAGQQATLTANGALSYTWSTGANTTSTIDSPSITTTYTVTGSDINNCSNYTVTSISVNPLPTLSTTTSSSILCTGQTATISVNGANTYTWSTSASSNSIVVNPSVNTTYTVSGTDANGCENTSVITQLVSTCAGLQESVMGRSEVMIYPNPNNGEFIVSLNDLTKKTGIEIYNTLGGLILVEELNHANNKIDIRKFSSGIYLVKLFYEKELIKTEKIIKNE